MKLFRKALHWFGNPKWFDVKAGTELFTVIKKVASADRSVFGQIKDRYVTRRCETGSFLTYSTRLYWYLSFRPMAHRMQLLTVLGLPSEPTHIPEICEWAANEVVPSYLGDRMG